MKLNNKQSIALIILLLTFLVTLNFLNQPIQQNELNTTGDINPVGQANDPDIQISSSDIKINDSATINEILTIETRIMNLGNVDAELVSVRFFIEKNNMRIQIYNLTLPNITAKTVKDIIFNWQIPPSTTPGEYKFIVTSDSGISGSDPNPTNNEASKTLTINSVLDIELKHTYAYPGRKMAIILSLSNPEDQQLNVTIDYYYRLDSVVAQNTTLFNREQLSVDAGSESSVEYLWTLPKDLSLGKYLLWFNLSNSSIPIYKDTAVEAKLNVIKYPDTTKTPVYMQTWFVVGLIALIIFFLTIIFSLIGVIPQDRLPIQPALVVMALVIMVLALVGHYLDPEVHLIGAQDIAGMVIIHPITALTAGFLVAGGLEAAGAFAAAADALGRIEKLKFKGKTIFGFTGTVVILTNIPTLIAMPCGRILGAALMPAALFFGYRLAKAMGDSRMVGVVVFSFIVNAAASCGPSPLGGIGTIGEGLSKMPIGSFTTAQSTGIMICTGVCALFMRFITFMSPSDLSDEEIRREKELEGTVKGTTAQAGTAGAPMHAPAPSTGIATETPSKLKEVDSKDKEGAQKPAETAKPVEKATTTEKPTQVKPAPAAVAAVTTGTKTTAPVAKAAPVAKKVDSK